MKTRIVFFFIVLFLVVLFASKENSYLKDKILLYTAPIKESYIGTMEKLSKMQKEHIQQQKNIEQLTQENQKLKEYLIEQTNYLNQIDKLFDLIPSLERLPHKSILLVQPIGYTKLNSYSTILLNKPEEIQENRVYGLMQNSFVIGTAQLRNGILYGHLISSNSCKFSVHIGKTKSPGVAIGSKSGYLKVEYIPKWSKIKEGDIVETSGVDKIFFANVPVGKVKSIKITSSYKTAIVEPYSDYLNINYLFLIQDPTPTLVSKYDPLATKLYPYDNNQFTPLAQRVVSKDKNSSIKNVQGDMVQTTMPEVDPKEHETPVEEKIKPQPKKKKVRVPAKPKLPKHGLDMF